MFNDEILAMTKKRCAAAAAICLKDISVFETEIIIGAAAVITTVFLSTTNLFCALSLNGFFVDYVTYYIRHTLEVTYN